MVWTVGETTTNEMADDWNELYQNTSTNNKNINTLVFFGASILDNSFGSTSLQLVNSAKSRYGFGHESCFRITGF